MRTAIGIDVGGTSTKGAIVAEDGRALLRVEHRTDPSAGTKGIISVLDELMERSAQPGPPPTSIGVGAAGFVDAAGGSISFSPNLTYDDPQIAAAIRQRTSLPVIVDNDANAAAWGERAFGAARGSDDVAVLTLGTGVGSGFIVAGRLLRGYSGAGAEFGHVVVDPDGPQCPCGLRGCVEQFSSGMAIARMGRVAVEEHPESSIVDFAGQPESITAEHVAKAARQFDHTARDVLRNAGRHLGIALSNIVNIFDPEVIVLAGRIIDSGEPFLGPARDTLVEMTSAQRRRAMRLDVTTLGHDAGILGAAALAFHEAA